MWVVLAARRWLTLFVAGGVTAVFVSSAILLLGGSVQAFLVSRDGVPPTDSIQIEVGQSLPEDMSAINRQLFLIASQAQGPTLCVAEFGISQGAPALAVYDNRPQPVALFDVQGRWFSSVEMSSATPVLIVRQHSYLLSDSSLGGSTVILPSAAQIGTFPQSLGTQFDFVVNMAAYTPKELPSVVYLQSTPDVIQSVVNMFLSFDPQVSIEGSKSVPNYLRSYLYTAPLFMAGVLCFLITAVITVDEMIRQSQRWRVARLLGASRRRAAWPLVRSAGAASLVGAGVGTILVLALVPHPEGTLPPGWSSASGGLAIALPALFVVVVSFVAVSWRGRLGRF